MKSANDRYHKDIEKAEYFLKQLNPNDFEHRKYLYYGVMSDFYYFSSEYKEATIQINLALSTVTNQLEKKHLEKKKNRILNQKG